MTMFVSKDTREIMEMTLIDWNPLRWKTSGCAAAPHPQHLAQVSHQEHSMCPEWPTANRQETMLSTSRPFHDA